MEQEGCTVPSKNANAQCGVCKAALATRTGEHAWPKWFQRDLDKQGPPRFKWTVQGKEITTKRGKPIDLGRRIRVLFPACEPCNSAMERTIEAPAKPLIRQLHASGWAGFCSAEDWRILGTWFLKCILLSHLPEARYELPAVDEALVRGFNDSSIDVSWLGRMPLDIPDDFSVFVHRTTTHVFATKGRLLAIPGVTRDHFGGLARSHHVGYSSDGPGISVVHHPGWKLNTEMVDRGEALDALRGRRGTDLNLLPLLATAGVSWLPMPVDLARPVMIGHQRPWLASMNPWESALQHGQISSLGGFQLPQP